MIVASHGFIDEVIFWWSTRRGRVSAPASKAIGHPAKPLSGGVRPLSDGDQTSFPLSGPLPDPRWFGPLPTPPRPRRRSAKNERAARWLRAQAAKNGGVPAFHVVQARFALPKATASRLRRDVVAEFAA